MLAIDLFCGKGGWTCGLLDAGFQVIGFDVEAYSEYPGMLVIQDVLTLHGRQFRDASLILASPPCQFFSYCAMPWSRAKKLAADVRSSPERMAQATALFDACFRIQREATLAAGHFIPLVVENVRGAQPWVGRARWNYGSFYLWGDVLALMPMTARVQKVPGFRFDGSGKSFQSAAVEMTGYKSTGMNWNDRTKRGQDFTRIASNQIRSGTGRNPVHELAGKKTCGHINKRDGHSHTRHLTNQREHDGLKSTARKAASAEIAKIPYPLARHIGEVYANSLCPKK